MSDEFQSEVLKGIARLEAKMDAATGRLDDHGKRLRALETFRNVASGAGTLLGALWIKTAVKIGISQP